MTCDKAQGSERTPGRRAHCEPSRRPSAPPVSTRDRLESPLVRGSRVELAPDSPPRAANPPTAARRTPRIFAQPRVSGPARPSPVRQHAPGPVHRPRTRRHGVHSGGGRNTCRQQRVTSSRTFAEVVSGLPAQASRSAESDRAVAGHRRGDSRRCSRRGCAVYSRPSGWGGRRPVCSRFDPLRGGDEV